MHGTRAGAPPDQVALPRPGGLRERKRVTTMRRIQQVALDLFDRNGYDRVTIEQIAEAAEVSPSSVYRYFGTKEGVVVRDDQDPVLLAALAGHLRRHDVWDAALLALQQVDPADFEEVLDLHLRRMRLFTQNQAVRARMLLEVETMTDELVAILAAPDAVVPRTEFDARVVATVLVSALLAAMEHWYAGGGREPIRELVTHTIDLIRSDRH